MDASIRLDPVLSSLLDQPTGVAEARARIVSIGLMPIGPGNRLASATNRPGTP
jgi:hypothetical protein